MDHRIIGADAAVCVVLGVTAAWCATSACGAVKDKPLPSFADVREAVIRHFELLPGYRPGDIIARSDVAPLFGRLGRLGFSVANREAILKKVPTDGDFLVRELRTRRGRKFMRRIANYPDAYDRLDRLSRLPHGKRTVHDLIRGPGGYKMIKYMTTTPGGKNLGRQLSNAPKGTDFNKPTGRIYTVKLLLAHLKLSYAAAKKGTSPSTATLDSPRRHGEHGD